MVEPWRSWQDPPDKGQRVEVNQPYIAKTHNNFLCSTVGTCVITDSGKKAIHPDVSPPGVRPNWGFFLNNIVASMGTTQWRPYHDHVYHDDKQNDPITDFINTFNEGEKVQLRAGSLRVMGGHVPAIFESNESNFNPRVAKIVWQGDLNKPCANRKNDLGDVIEDGEETANRLAQEVIDTFAVEGLAAAAKKVVK